MVYYLKYRPQKIADLDLEQVRQSLTEILASSHIPHAFLFVGPKGTGKTSSARIVAKSLNCTAKKSGSNGGEPCNKCEMCRAITKGTAVDLIEIDAASNRGIDDIRDLREKIKLSPALAAKKVYIIDEVHMLTKEAFNALLKTLEEPPEHALFVLCTTEPHKVPGTIRSRCWRVDFNKATTKEIVRSLKKVVRGEKLKIAEADLGLIARQVDGSFRDGMKLLEQLAVGGKRISSKKVKEMLRQGLARVNIDEWLVLVYQRKTQEALSWLSQVTETGIDATRFIAEALERLRQILLLRLGVESGEDIKELEEVGKIRELVRVLIKAGREIKGATIEALPLELAVMEWGNERQNAKRKTQNHNPKVKTNKLQKQQLSAKSAKLDIKVVEEKWNEILQAVRPHNHSLEALLRAARPTGFEGKFLVLEVFYKFHKERLEVDRYRQLVEEVASTVLATPVNIRYYLSERTKTALKKETGDDNISLEVDDDIVSTAEEVFGVKVD